MASVERLAQPRKSHRKEVHLPEKSAKLAEFFGIMMGDGGINNAWQANITLNAITDKEYAAHVAKFGKGLFGVEPAVRKRKNKNALVISFAGIALVDFLTENGLPRGNKLKAGLHIPDWVMLEERYRAACLRGLVDTDGCLYIHKHVVGRKEYRNIGLCFSSHSPALMRQVAGIFVEFGIIPHINRDGRGLFLYREDAIVRYLKVIGTSNERIKTVYRNWRRG